jgi:hypothetical protein
MKPDLDYVGNGRFLIGIPADRLTELDLAIYAERRGKTETTLRKELVDSGLYAESKPEKEKQP